MQICVSKLTIIGSDNGLSPDRRQAFIWTNAGLLLIGPLWTNSSETLIEILTFSFKKMRWKVSSAKQRPFCLGLNVLMTINKWDPEQRLQVKQHRLQPNLVAGCQSHSSLQYILPRWLKRIWACLNIKTIFSGMGIPNMKIKQSWDHCIFITGIPTLVRHHFYIETLSAL